MKRRIFGSVMAILVIAMMLAGCGGTTNKEDNNSTNDTTTNAPVIDENNKENTDDEIIEDDEIVSGDVIEDGTEDGTAVEEKEYDLSASYTVVYDGSKEVTGQMENLVLADNSDWADKKVTFTTDGVTGTLSMTAPTVIGNNAIMTQASNGAERVMLFGEPSYYMIYVNVATGTEEEFTAYYNDMQNLTSEDLIENVGNLVVEDGIYEVEKSENYVRTYAQYVSTTNIPHPSITLMIVSDETNCEYEIIITDFSLKGETLPEETRTEMMEILKSIEVVVE